MFKKIGLGILTILLLASAVAIIGWIGFQEHFRLLARSFQIDQAMQDKAVTTQDEEVKLNDHTIIETEAEAYLVIENLEARLLGLENDGLPVE